MTIATATILEGHVLDVLAGMDAGSVHSCITSPPFWGLRDYKLEPQVWGGDAGCEHRWGAAVGGDPVPPSKRQCRKCGRLCRTQWTSDCTVESHCDNCNTSTSHKEVKTRGALCVKDSGNADNWSKANSRMGYQAFCHCGAWRGHLGLEPTIDGFIDNLVAVFDGVRRVLRDDGLCFVNLGDSYTGGKGEGGNRKGDENGQQYHGKVDMPTGLKPLDLCNVPHRFALRMQAEGWWLRSTIIWAKGVSFCDSYSGSVMPESLSGTRWERCRVKTGDGPKTSTQYNQAPTDSLPGYHGHCEPTWSPCPGCPKCEPNDGLVLRRGSWRPTSAYEYVFMFAKSSSYWCDGEGVREEGVREWNPATNGPVGRNESSRLCGGNQQSGIGVGTGSGRNLRNVWLINPQSFADAHFATYPEALVEPLIKCSTSDKGVCPECGGQWARVVEREGENIRECAEQFADEQQISKGKSRSGTFLPNSTTLGWRPTCGCGKYDSSQPYPTPIPATVLDPLLGSGTTLLTARKLGRNGIGIELNPEYAEMARKRLGEYAPLFSGNPTK